METTIFREKPKFKITRQGEMTMGNRIINKMRAFGSPEDVDKLRKRVRGCLDLDPHFGHIVLNRHAIVPSLADSVLLRTVQKRDDELLLQWESSWPPEFDLVSALSSEFTEMLFDLFYFEQLPDGVDPDGERVFKNGEVLAYWLGECSSTVMFAPIEGSRPHLYKRYLPMTLAARANKHVEQAVEKIRDLDSILHDETFTKSPLRKRSDPNKVKSTTEAIASLLEHMEQAAAQIDFNGVFVEYDPSKDTEDTD